MRKRRAWRSTSSSFQEPREDIRRKCECSRLRLLGATLYLDAEMYGKTLPDDFLCLYRVRCMAAVADSEQDWALRLPPVESVGTAWRSVSREASLKQLAPGSGGKAPAADTSSSLRSVFVPAMREMDSGTGPKAVLAWKDSSASSSWGPDLASLHSSCSQSFLLHLDFDTFF